MKKIMAAAVALCMLGGVAFAQNATTTTASHKHAVKKEAKATNSNEHVAKAEKASKHEVAKKEVKATHVKAKKTASAKKES